MRNVMVTKKMFVGPYLLLHIAIGIGSRSIGFSMFALFFIVFCLLLSVMMNLIRNYFIFRKIKMDNLINQHFQV